MNWKTWKCKGLQYIAVKNGDGWHVTNEHGDNFGAWQAVETFRRLQRDNDPNGFLGMPNTFVCISVRTGIGENPNKRLEPTQIS